MSPSAERWVARGALILIVVLFVPVFLALQASPAMACQCVPRLPLQHLAGADAVFIGRLAEIEGPPALRQTYSSMDPITYRFGVDKVLKGAVPVHAAVRSVVSGGSCGLERMEIGKRYTVFAIEQNSTFVAGLCGGTHVGDPDLTLALFSGGVPLDPTPGVVPWWAPFLPALASILGATVFWRGWSLFRRRRRTSSGRAGGSP